MIELLQKPTRFRAYQIGCPGSSFSYFDGERFYLIEAILTDTSENSVVKELYLCQREKIDVLHITSWDRDHCSPNALRKILTYLNPDKIEIPGYSPISDSGRESLSIIQQYITHKRLIHEELEVYQFTPEFISSLNGGQAFAYSNVIYNPYYISSNCNDNSTIKLFRSGCFTVASLGDAESEIIAERLLQCQIFKNEVDVMILAHHGADNGFTTEKFISIVKPAIALSCSDYNNQFEHPRKEIRDILYNNNVDIYTTKTGDVVITSIGNNTYEYLVTNLKASSDEVSSRKAYVTKRGKERLLKDLLRIK